MSTAQTPILFPPGRMVMGSLYKPQDKDAQGAPLVIKTGPNKGQPTVKYFFAAAIPKKPGETHWASTEWGAKIWALGHASWPQGQAQTPTFAWKVDDGDSAIPNKRGRKNVETEGYAGHWVVNFSSSYAPKIVNSDGSQYLLEPDAVKCGYYIEVLGSISTNNNPTNPGVYVNHNVVAFRGVGTEIRTGIDPRTVGFGKAAAPAGATAAPTGNAMAPPPAAPAAVAPPPAAPIAPPPATTVQPHPAFMGAPSAPAAPPPPPAAAPPPPATGPVWKGAAGTTYDSYKQAGWSDDQMRANGLLA